MKSFITLGHGLDGLHSTTRPPHFQVCFLVQSNHCIVLIRWKALDALDIS